MATTILRMKKATRTASVKNESLLRTKTIQRAATLLKQVSDPTRLQVVTLLTERERHVGGLCEELTQTPPVMSHHLALLRHVGIVDRRRPSADVEHRGRRRVESHHGDPAARAGVGRVPDADATNAREGPSLDGHGRPRWAVA